MKRGVVQKLRYDLLGAIKYQDQALRAVEPGTVIAVLDGVFSPSMKPHNDLYAKILRSKKNLELVVHCNWSSSHNYDASHLTKAMKIVGRLKKITKKIVGSAARVYVSPYLESRASESFLTKTFEELRGIAPEFKYINSMIGTIRVIPGVITEIHNTDWDRKPISNYILSVDGVDPREVNISAWKQQHKNAVQFGMWDYSFNGRASLYDQTPPLSRKNWPTVKKIKQIAALYYGEARPEPVS